MGDLPVWWCQTEVIEVKWEAWGKRGKRQTLDEEQCGGVFFSWYALLTFHITIKLSKVGCEVFGESVNCTEHQSSLLKTTGGNSFSIDCTDCCFKAMNDQISVLNDDPHSSPNFFQTLLKIGTRCPREEKQIPKWAHVIEYHLPNNVWPSHWDQRPLW